MEEVIGGEYILDCFWNIIRFRDFSENGHQPLKPVDVFNWEKFTGNILNREERIILLELDQAYLAALEKERSINMKRLEEKNKNK